MTLWSECKKSMENKEACESYSNKYQGEGKVYYPEKPLCSWNNMGVYGNNGYEMKTYKCM